MVVLSSNSVYVVYTVTPTRAAQEGLCSVAKSQELNARVYSLQCKLQVVNQLPKLWLHSLFRLYSGSRSFELPLVESCGLQSIAVWQCGLWNTVWDGGVVSGF